MAMNRGSSPVAADHREALKIYSKITSTGGRVSVSVILAALKACSSLRDLETGRQIHTAVLSTGQSTNLFIASTLVDMYAKCGSMIDARRVFNGMSSRNLVAWNCIILGYASHPATAATALALYWQMQNRHNLSPNRVTFLAAIKACGKMAEQEEEDPEHDPGLKTESLNTGRQIHLLAEELLASGTGELHIFVANALVEMYSKCGSISDSIRVFDRIREKNLVSWNTIILALAQAGLPERALEMFYRMDCRPDALTLIAALRACSILRESESVRAIHRRADEIGACSDPRVAAGLIEGYSRCRLWGDAIRVLETSSGSSPLPWTATIQCYTQADLGEKALEIWGRLPKTGIQPTNLTLIAALKACTSVRDEHLKSSQTIRSIHLHAERMNSDHDQDTILWNALLEAYAQKRHLLEAWMIFDSRHKKSLVTWNCLLAGLGECGRIDPAMNLLLEMKQRGIQPSSITYTAMLKACTSATQIGTGRVILGEAHRAGLMDHMLMNSQVNFWGKCGCSTEAHRVLDSMSHADTVTWNSIISAYAHVGEVGPAMRLLSQMREEGIEPDVVSLLGVLSGCSHRGEVDVGKKVLSYGGGDVWGRRLVGCLVDMLGRANRLEEAAEVIEERCRDGVVAWMTLLAGCHKWGNVEIGEMAFRNVLRLSNGCEVDDSEAALVLMSNIYAAAGMWLKRAQLRSVK